jgi:putative transposase
MEGDIKTVTIKRTSTNKWFVTFVCDNVSTKPLPKTDKSVGIDPGLDSFFTDSSGLFVENPRFYRKLEDKLAEAQRVLEKKREPLKEARARVTRLRNSKETSQQKLDESIKLLQCKEKAYEKARLEVAKIHEKIANLRDDFTNKIVYYYVLYYDLIAIEDTQVKNMVKRPKPKQDEETKEYLPNGASAKAGLNKSILDAYWTSTRNKLSAKAVEAEKEVIKVPARNTSKECCKCGFKIDMPLDVRIHKCPKCGFEIQRDLGSSITLLGRAVPSVKEEWVNNPVIPEMRTLYLRNGNFRLG